MKNVTSLSLFITLLLFATSCGAPADKPTDKKEPKAAIDTGLPEFFVKPTVERDKNPSIEKSSLESCVMSNTKFGLDFYRKLTESNDNFVFSPIAVSMPMALFYPYSRGETRRQLDDKFGFGELGDKLDDNMNFISMRVNQSDEFLEFETSMNTSIFLNKKYSFEQEFIDRAWSKYGIPLGVQDFSNRDSIGNLNQFISDQSKGLFKNSIGESDFNDESHSLLITNLFIDAKWDSQFPSEMIKKENFYLADGTEVSVDMMRNNPDIKDYRYFKNPNLQAIAIPFRGDIAEMVIVLPDPGAMQAVETAITADLVLSLIEKLEGKTVNLWLPKWKADTTIDLDEVFKSLGLNAAFIGSGEFEGITKVALPQNQGLSSAKQSISIQVNEEGVLATASQKIEYSVAQSVSMGEPVDFKVNRPFIYFIVEKSTRTIILAGRVMNPLE